MLMPLLLTSLLVVRAFAGESTLTTSTPLTRSLLRHATHRNLNRTYYTLSPSASSARLVAKRFRCSYEYRRSRWQAIATLRHDRPQPGLADNVAVCLAPVAGLAQAPCPTSTLSPLLVVPTGTPELVLARAPRKTPLPRMSRKVWLLSSPCSQL
jgi:hypothetical protein